MKPFVLTAEEKVKLASRLRKTLPEGKVNAIRGKDLAFKLGYPDDRKIRLAIRDLIHEGLAVASSVSEPMGFYIVANPIEAYEYIHVLNNRIREDKARLSDFEKAVADMQLPVQESMI